MQSWNNDAVPEDDVAQIKEAYNDCMQLKNQWNLVKQAINRLESFVVLPTNWSECCTDQLQLVGETLLEQLVLLNVSNVALKVDCADLLELFRYWVAHGTQR